MDRRPGQRCAQLDWHRCLLQPAELRADVWLPHRTLATGDCGPDWDTSPSGPYAWHRAPLCSDCCGGTHARSALERRKAQKDPQRRGAGAPTAIRPGQLLSRAAHDAYDLIREGLVALIAVFVLVVAFAGFLSSPDEPPLTLQQYAQQNPVGFVTTAMKELTNTSVIAQYGPPYNSGTGSVQFIGPLSLQQVAGVTIPIDTAHVYVLDPLAVAAQTDPQVAAALQTFTRAEAKQRAAWEDAYTTALSKATGSNGHVAVPPGDDGP